MTTKSRRSPVLDPSADAKPVSDVPTSQVHGADKDRGPGWTVTEQFVREGYRYRLMRRPIEPSDSGPRFTRREVEALALASDGCSNKRIAQILDVSPSTVGVLLFRAASKLNVKTRGDLLTAYRHLVVSSPAAESTAGPMDSRRAK